MAHTRMPKIRLVATGARFNSELIPTSTGDIVYLNVMGQPTVILNKQKTAADLLDRRAATCSSRPRLILAGELLCGGKFLPFMPYGDQWRRVRRAVNEAFKISVASRYHGMEEEEATRLALTLASDTKAGAALDIEHLGHRFYRYTGSIIMAITYDRPFSGVDAAEDDRIRTRIEEFDFQAGKALKPGAHLVEALPWMLRIPSR